MAELKDILLNKLRLYGDDIVQGIQEKLLAGDKLATGDLYNSITYGVSDDGDMITLTIYANDYLKYIDQGFPGGKKMPPTENILSWIQIRGIRPKPSSGIPQKYWGLPRADRSLAFLIARKIQRDGMQATYALSDTLSSINGPMLNDVNELVTGWVKELILNSFKEIQTELLSPYFQMTINVK
jgi:hypothetical protein